MGQRYVRVLAAAGAIPWIIPLLQDDEETLRCIYEALDGVFLTGGVDVDPAQYGEAPHDLCGRIDPARDWTELTLVRWAMRDGKPVLGVCRGIQVINVAAGGSLYQDMAAQYPNGIKHDYFPTPGGYTRESLVHQARLAPDSHLGRIIGLAEVEVNSMHHQSIKTLAPGFVPTAYAPDRSIEGIESQRHPFLIGVQWHPEELVSTQPYMQRLFSAFIEAAQAYHQAATPGWQKA
jgi:putative glutamine amidotransferase